MRHPIKANMSHLFLSSGCNSVLQLSLVSQLKLSFMYLNRSSYINYFKLSSCLMRLSTRFDGNQDMGT
jgi:hypothetical protein